MRDRGTDRDQKRSSDGFRRSLDATAIPTSPRNELLEICNRIEDKIGLKGTPNEVRFEVYIFEMAFPASWKQHRLLISLLANYPLIDMPSEQYSRLFPVIKNEGGFQIGSIGSIKPDQLLVPLNWLQV